MKIHPAGSHAHQLTRMGFFNCYLVRESDSFTLIDTTMKGGGATIVEGARGLAPEPVARVLLTHAHADHVGSVDELARDLGQVSVAAGEREAPMLRKPPDLRLLPGEPQSKVKGMFPGIETRLTHLVNDGELFGSLRVLTTPGHTPGHASFFDERDGTLYAGDALGAVGDRICVSGFTPWYLRALLRFTWHRPTALASADRLLEVLGTEIRRYACGHGKVIEGGPAVLRQAIEDARAELR